MYAEIKFAHVRFAQACELLADILPLKAPADQVIERYFKANRQMGSKDRGFAAETVYGCLRYRRELNFLFEDLTAITTEFDEAKWLVASYMLRYGGWGLRNLEEAKFRGDGAALVCAVRTKDLAGADIAIRANLSDDYCAPLQSQMSEQEIIDLMRAMNQPAPVDLRVNTLKSTREQLMQELEQDGYPCTPTPYSPLGLRRAQRGPLFNLPAFKKGFFELQDEGSQLIGVLAQAKPKHLIVDFCAGAGGKSLLLGAQMHNKGTVVACDTSPKRLGNISPRLARSGVDNIRTQVLQDENDPALKTWRNKADCVIVDAPCSGSGTWRRNPDMKWRSIDLQALPALQLRILSAAATLVKAGGRVLYATCSLLKLENEDVVTSFLSTHPEFSLLAAGPILNAEGVTNAEHLVSAEGMLRTQPDRHLTDGFFAAVLQRQAKAAEQTLNKTADETAVAGTAAAAPDATETPAQ